VPTSPEQQTTRPTSHRTATRAVTAADIPAVQAFLEAHLDTSIFLLSNLVELGIRATPSPLSGNFRLVEHDGALAGVFCLTRKGDLLAQTGGRADLASEILAACALDPFTLAGVIAEWHAAESIWRLALSDPGFSETYHCKSLVYRLDRQLAAGSIPSDIVIRALTVEDYEVWEPVDRAFYTEEGLEVSADEERRRFGFRLRAEVGGWWGAFDGTTLVSTACLNAAYGVTGQVGGVYTRPAYRRRGLAWEVMRALMQAHHERRGLSRIVLFTAETNVAARAMYESMGFTACAGFGLLFGKRLDG
jgi:RimJ/RimL family protein N-acetyltransferase